MSGLASVEAARRPRHAGGADLPRARLGQAPAPGRRDTSPAEPDRARARAVPRRRPRRRHLQRRGVRAAPAGAAQRPRRRSCRAAWTPRCSRRAARWRRASGRPRLLVLGRLVERKGVRTTPSGRWPRCPTPSWSSSAARRPTTLDADPEVRRLRAIAAEPGVGRPAGVRRGGRRGPTCPRWIRSADVVLAVPWYEPFGITPLEAMACGAPGGRPPPSAGWSTPSSTASPATWCRRATRTALGEALAALLADDERRAGLRRRRACGAPAPATAGAASSPTPRPSTAQVAAPARPLAGGRPMSAAPIRSRASSRPTPART